MRITCPKCKYRQDVPDESILHEVERNPSLRSKIASILGKLTGGQTKLDAEGRRQRALKAVHAREAKRKKQRGR